MQPFMWFTLGFVVGALLTFFLLLLVDKVSGPRF